jgi:putative Mg2+ transporter-C (MgtC) family protein
MPPAEPLFMLAHQEIVLRLFVAAILGAAVGLERERLEWVAGLRTHMLVCLGAALVMIVSAYGFNEVISAYRVVLDPSRVAAQVVSGIGFLGAGTILFLRQQVIRGLTTAASLWAVAAVGLAVGGGLYLAAMTTTALIIVILALVKPLERRLFHRQGVRSLTVVVNPQVASIQRIEAEIAAGGLSVQQVTLRHGETAQEDYLEFALTRSAPTLIVTAVLARLQQIDGVRDVRG